MSEYLPNEVVMDAARRMGLSVRGGPVRLRRHRLVKLYIQGRGMAERGVVFFSPKRGLSQEERMAMLMGHSDAVEEIRQGGS